MAASGDWKSQRSGPELGLSFCGMGFGSTLMGQLMWEVFAVSGVCRRMTYWELNLIGVEEVSEYGLRMEE